MAELDYSLNGCAFVMSDTHLLATFYFCAITVLACLGTGAAVRVARRLRLLAHPVERSSHTIPTPQVGGVGFGIALLAGLLVLPLLWPHWAALGLTSAHRCLILVIAWGLALGLVDDILALGAISKLAAMIGMAALPVLFGITLPPAAIPGLSAHLPQGPFLAAVFCMGWMLFFINAYNFMDGANGLSALFTLNTLFWLAACLVGSGTISGASASNLAILLPMLALAAAMIGFLPWNFPRAATFMGDSGSLPMGGALAFLVLYLSGEVGLPLPAILMPFSLYLFDVLYTLIRRLRNRENILQAHRSHLYQRLLIATDWSHTRLQAFLLPFYLITGMCGFGYVLAAGILPRLLWTLTCLAALLFYLLTILRKEQEATPHDRK